MASNNKFTTGSVIPHSGIYAVIHSAHRLPPDVTLIQGEKFPRCARCNDGVTFTLVCPVRSGPGMLQVRIYELPVIEEDDAAAVGTGE